MAEGLKMDEIKIKIYNKTVEKRDCKKIAETLEVDYDDVRLIEDNIIEIYCTSDEVETLRDEGRFFEEICYALNISRTQIEEIDEE